jgi:D-tyrosyl-tRNA(Tyr) deacylase
LTATPGSGQHAGMLALIQRVTEAAVRVDGEVVGAVGAGLLALVAVEPGDGEAQVARMAERLLGYRVFSDAAGRMNLSLADTGGGLLLVPQFTLAADTSRGMRPSFTSAATPEDGRRGFDALVARCREAHPMVETGRFGAHMQVSLVNDGPVTFRLHVPPVGAASAATVTPASRG